MDDVQSTTMDRVKLFCFFALFCVLTLLLPYATFSEVSQVSTALGEHVLAFRERSFSPSLVLATPVFAVLTYLLWLRATHTQVSDRLLSGWFKLCGVTLVLMLIATPIYTYLIEHHISAQGYTLCSAYGRGTIGSADIWVANESHCIKEGFPVRNELVDWLSQQPSDISAQQVKQKLATLLAAQHHTK
ncbi:hypothetical protein [Pseudoalteromonas ruthenica]|uniref:hypothetical protein n=1 Tax=Pseudoalteromonas ruthenica TaxID=151081 RepID=UPI001244FEA3|nr:hypothetical protein [Pseudoalteromonas ruthenica]